MPAAVPEDVVELVAAEVADHRHGVVVDLHPHLGPRRGRRRSRCRGCRPVPGCVPVDVRREVTGEVADDGLVLARDRVHHVVPLLVAVDHGAPRGSLRTGNCWPARGSAPVLGSSAVSACVCSSSVGIGCGSLRARPGPAWVGYAVRVSSGERVRLWRECPESPSLAAMAEGTDTTSDHRHAVRLSAGAPGRGAHPRRPSGELAEQLPAARRAAGRFPPAPDRTALVPARRVRDGRRRDRRLVRLASAPRGRSLRLVPGPVRRPCER